MCGIVGLFLKDERLEPELGALLAEMLVTMSDRGPDSAGFAVYGAERAGLTKMTLQSATPEKDFAALDARLSKGDFGQTQLCARDTHAIVALAADKIEALRAALPAISPGLRVMSVGANVEIYKEIGLPREVVKRFGLAQMSGTHGVGHTRMATESAVTTLGAHPFSSITARSPTTTTCAAN
jgi:glutamate synthase domain-containing protein 1